MKWRELMTRIHKAKGLDARDNVMAEYIAERLIHAPRMLAKRGRIAITGKQRGAIARSARPK